MSVYRPRRRDGSFASPFFQYDFELSGRRFHGSTKKKTRREALEVERDSRILARDVGDETTIGGAFLRFWNEVGQHDRDSDTTFYRMENLQDGLTATLAESGTKPVLSAISADALARYVSRRRGIVGRHGKPLAPATVNRELQLLRRIMRRAANVWTHPLRIPAWKTLFLEEPEEHVVDIPPKVEELVLAAMRADFRPALQFLIMSGLREGSVLASPGGHGPLTPEAVDFDAGVLTVKTKSKKPGGRTLRLPITQAMMVLLANEIGKHPDAVFTYTSHAATQGRWRGHRYPITVTAFYKEFKRAAAAAGFPKLRPHDLRHTAGNRTLAATGNLRLTQKMLGHTRVSTTQRYTHPDLEALREAMELAHKKR